MSDEVALYHAVKAKFSVVPGMVGFVDLVADVDAMEIRYVPAGDKRLLSEIRAERWKRLIPFAVFDGSGREHYFIFTTLGFYQDENLTTGRILEYGRDPFGLDFRRDKRAILKELADLARVLKGET